MFPFSFLSFFLLFKYLVIPFLLRRNMRMKFHCIYNQNYSRYFSSISIFIIIISIYLNRKDNQKYDPIISGICSRLRVQFFLRTSFSKLRLTVRQFSIVNSNHSWDIFRKLWKGWWSPAEFERDRSVGVYYTVWNRIKIVLDTGRVTFVRSL